MVPDSWQPIIQSAAQQYDIDPALMTAQLTVESQGNPNAVGPQTKWGRAQGGAQLMPDTAKSLGVTDPTDPNQFIPAQAKLMRENLDRYDGDTVMALKGYHGGPNQKNWGAQTNAYPNKVLAEHQRLTSMDNGITTTPLLPPGAQYFPDQGDGQGGFYFDPVTGRMIPEAAMKGSYSPPTPGANAGYTPDGDNSAPGPSLDNSQLPPMGNVRGQVPTTAQPPQAPSTSGGALPPDAPPGLFSDLSSDISKDPVYGKLYDKAGWAGMFGNQGLIGGYLAGQAGVMKNRIDNNMLAQRAMMAYGTPIARGVANGVPLNDMRAAVGLPPVANPAANYSSKGMQSGPQKDEQADLESIGEQRRFQIGAQHFGDLIKAGAFHLDPVSRAKYWVQNSGLPGTSPTEESKNYLQFKAFLESQRQNIQNEAKGATSDKRSDEAMAALTGGGTLKTDEQGLAHLNYLGNDSALMEKNLEGRINSRREGQKQPAYDFATYEKSLPPSPYAGKSAREIGSNAFGENGQSVEKKGVGQGGFGVGQTRNIGGVNVKRVQ